tara:strand:+ start:163 stop:891 length:729 start_codon:yes stop_codon:yes gene_type:complete
MSFLNLFLETKLIPLQIDPTLLKTSVNLTFSEGITILITSLIFGIYLRFLYFKLAITYSSKTSFGNTLLIVTISVASLVAVVKASLALSLGLVGALSVIRFRTAVKEPYNLSYILLAICIAISIGASQYLFSLLIAIVGTMAVGLAYRSEKSKSSRSTKNADDIDTVYITLPFNSSLDELKEILIKNTLYFSILSMDQVDGKSINVVLKVKLNDFDSLSQLKTKIFDVFPNSEFRFFNSPDI